MCLCSPSWKVKDRILDYVPASEALNSCRLTLASEWMMSDFEFNIRSAFADVFPNITIDGCSFHWAKCIIVKVHICGFKPT